MNSRPRDSVVFSPEELDEALSRLDLIDSLKKKYGNTIDEILEYQAKLAEDLAVSENFDETKNSLMERAQRIEGYTCRRLQASYTSTRKKGLQELAQAIQKELHDLNFNDSSVKIAVEPLKEPTAEGMDKVEILITTNKGEPLKPLYKISLWR